MQAQLYADISTLGLTDSLGGDAYSFPRLVAPGSHITLQLRLAEQVDGAAVTAERIVHGIKASIGNLDARPESGSYKLIIGGHSTGFISFDASAEALESAINALAGLADGVLPCTVSDQDGSYRIRFHDGSQHDIDCSDNALWPLSFVTVAASQFEGAWIHTLRLVQAPGCETVDHVLANASPPVVSRVQEGGGDAGASWNELQRLSIPANFNSGSFQLRRGYKRTTAIGLPTSGAEIQTALNAIADDGGSFIVTEEQDAVLIEFAGTMAGRSQDLLEVFVIEGPTPSIQFTLDTDTAGMAVLMQRPDTAGEVKLPLEIVITLQDVSDPDTLHPVYFHADLTFVRQLNREDRSTAAQPNWNQPLQRRNYSAYGPGQFLIGQRHARFPIGDDTSATYELNHNLNADEIFVTVRDNNAYGRQWRDVEYSVTFNGPNSVILDFADPIPHNALIVLVTTCNQPATFVAHTHTIDDIDGLRVQLTAIQESLSALNAIAPQGGLTVDTATATDATAVIAEWDLPAIADLYPTRVALTNTPKTLAEITVEQLAALSIRDGGLLPALHRVNVADMIDPTSATGDDIGQVFQNNTGADIKLPGGRGRPRDTLRPGEHAAYNGWWYKVAQDGVSWFPVQFNRSLFELAVNERQLRFKKTFTLNFGIEVGILSLLAAQPDVYASSPFLSEAQWSVLLEWGEFTEDLQADDEDPPDQRDTAPNLQGINWHTEAPIFDQRIILTSTPMVHQFGCEIIRDAAGNLSCNRILYGGKEGADAPTVASFALRARLARFDTRNDVIPPQGLVAVIGLARAIGSASSDNMGIAQIK